jgi:hypothetical protein
MGEAMKEEKRKLFVVSVELSAAVLAESESQAREIVNAQWVLKDELDSIGQEFDCYQGIAPGWNGKLYVYHAGEYGITLDEAKAIDEDARKWEAHQAMLDSHPKLFNAETEPK